MTYKETLAHIYALGRFGIRPGLERITRLLEALGNPQQSLHSVHLAGTNGKGSTASFLGAILDAGGYRTGLFTSPHLICFTERIRIGGVEIDEATVCRLAGRVLAAAPPESTFFEIVTALAVLYFAEQGVEIALFEAGMGGRLDATNVLPGLLTVLTPISLDHCDYLGSTLPAIAAEKAGLCKPGTPLVSACQEPAAAEVVAREAARLGAPLYRCGREFDALWRDGSLEYRGLSLTLSGLLPGVPGRYQSGNAACALAAAELIGGLGFPLGADALARGVAQARWPGRMELFPGPPRILLDGAHNPAGARALAEALADLPRRRLILLLGVMGDKELDGILAPLLPLAQRIFTATPALPRALAAEDLARLCRERGYGAEPAGSIAEALVSACAAAQGDDLVLLCGSLFSVGEARAHLLSRGFEPFRG